MALHSAPLPANGTRAALGRRSRPSHAQVALRRQHLGRRAFRLQPLAGEGALTGPCAVLRHAAVAPRTHRPAIAPGRYGITLSAAEWRDIALCLQGP
jgi:hypothetical protein